MNDILGSLTSEGWSWLSTFISIAILKATDYAARIVGNRLKVLISKIWLRYLLFFLLAFALLYGSGYLFKWDRKPNLYRKYGATRLYSSTGFRELYRKLAREVHPDFKGSRGDFNSMNTDLKLLTNDKSRLFYDRYGVTNTEVGVEEEFAQQLAKAFECFMDYFIKSAFTVVFISDEPNLHTKMSTLGLIMACLLYDIYNLTARTATATDPLDFVYPDLTLHERSILIRQYFGLFFFLLITFKFAFETPWVLRFREIATYSFTVLNYLEEMDVPQHKLEWRRQNKVIRECFYDLAKTMKIAIDRRQHTSLPQPVGEEDGQSPARQDSLTRENLEENKVDSVKYETEQRGMEGGQEGQREPDPTPFDILKLIGWLLKAFLTFYLINMGIKFLANL